ncbi:MAG TPA: hypothetical protein VK285_04375 [Gaiellaceae bacterium]|nr:hypothetical protein [Gaiellaceae bacterium]
MKVWQPEGLDLSDTTLKTLSYVVVDEVVEDAARLSVSAWPRIDAAGRLRFAGDERPRSVRADLGQLRTFVNSNRAAGRSRPSRLRMGTVLAARIDKSVLPEPESNEELREQASSEPRHPGEWMEPPVYDITGAARDKAKEAFYAAVAPTVKVGRRA